MIVREPADAEWDAAAPDNPVGRAVALFVERTWPGEALSDDERRELERRARCGMSLDSAGGESADVPPDGLPAGCAAGAGVVARRMDAALTVARRTRHRAARILAKRGALRPCRCDTRPGTAAWALDLAGAGADGPLALDRHGRLRDTVEGLVDLWAAGDRPALVLIGGPAETVAVEELRAVCEALLRQCGASRGWSAPPEVLRADSP